MATYVLIHGARHDGSAFDRVVERLHQQGHTAFAPTVAGHRKDVDEQVSHADEFEGSRNLPIPSGEPMYRLPFGTLASLRRVGPILGMGRAAPDLAVGKAPGNAISHDVQPPERGGADPSRRGGGEAAMKLKTAQLQAYSAADELDAAVARGDPVSYRMRTEMRAQAGYAAHQVLEAIQILVNMHGKALLGVDEVVTRMV